MYVTDEDIHTNEPIEADKPLEELRQEPYSLPAGFCWDSLDIDNPIVVCCCVSWLNVVGVSEFMKIGVARREYLPEYFPHVQW